MTLFLAIIFPVASILLFKLFGTFKVNTMLAVIINYTIACLLCLYLFDQEVSYQKVLTAPWIVYALICGSVFILNFYIIAKSTQKNGVGITTLSNKMSLIIPVSLGIILLSEALNIFKGIGLILALLGIILVTNKQNKSFKKLWLLLVVFILTGAMEFILSYVQDTFFSSGSGFELFTATTFAASFLFGLIPLVLKIKQLSFMTILGGISLGFTNGLGVYYLFKALQNSTDNGLTLSIINIGGLLIASIVGSILFKERLSWVNSIGIALCVLSIYIFQTL